MCLFHQDRLLQQYSINEGDNRNNPVITGVTMDRSSWKLLPGENQIPALSESEALKLVGGKNPHLI